DRARPWFARQQGRPSGFPQHARDGARPGEEALRRRQDRAAGTRDGSSGGSQREVGAADRPWERTQLPTQRIQFVPQSQLIGTAERSPEASVSPPALSLALGLTPLLLGRAGHVALWEISQVWR